jgi:hypothetical protein
MYTDVMKNYLFCKFSALAPVKATYEQLLKRLHKQKNSDCAIKVFFKSVTKLNDPRGLGFVFVTLKVCMRKREWRCSCVPELREQIPWPVCM